MGPRAIPRRSVHTQTDDGLVFLMGDTVTVAVPGGGTGIQLQGEPFPPTTGG